MNNDKNAPSRKSKAADELEAEFESREEDEAGEERATRENLNQGSDTGTTDFVHRGANWPPSYRVRTKEKEKPSTEPDKDSKDSGCS
jgi:hypothetical protein